MKILVTGGAGYIGSVLVPKLLENGHEVFIIDKFLYHQTSLLNVCHHKKLNIIRGDARDQELISKYLKTADAILAMYHDQALPVVKFQGFGEAVNVTLGLPILRTSVDHGTALDVAGTAQADAGSLIAAIQLAIKLLVIPA